MRCDECKVEPVTPNHFCECCGRKLSLQERQALDEKKALDAKKAASAQTSWGEPAPVLPKAPKGDRLVGIHFTPEPYVDGPGDEPAPIVDPVDVDTHVRDFDVLGLSHGSRSRARANRSDSRGALAGRALVEAASDSQVPAPPAAPVVEPQVSADAPRRAPRQRCACGSLRELRRTCRSR